ncbi:MAG: S46 family peptidase, partial [Gemmataceae bacterium]
LPMTARTDEGMWLPNDPPRATLQTKYQFELDAAFLTRAMKASVRFNNGGSGGFVSPQGLIVTNHHIAADSLQKLSTPVADLYENGFLAKTLADERPCPDLELNVLQEIIDVTEQVQGAVKPDMSTMAAGAARRAVMNQIEKDSLAKTGLRSDVVELYQGGAFHLYRYKKFTDVRLVFAPEHGIAAFGGDVDNFEYPRFGLDFAFFRAYENGAPAQVEHYFRWAKTGPAANDLVFVSGHPGRTNRLETLAQLQHRRDVTLPYTLARLRTMEAALEQFGARGPEQRRQIATDLHSVANARKASSGQYQGLLDPKILDTKKAQESGLTTYLGRAGEPALTAEDRRLKPWLTVADVHAKFAHFEREYALLERGDAVPARLFTIARHLVRLSRELPKPNSERLREYRDSALESLKFELFSPAPIYLGAERTKLTAGLTFLAENLTGKNPLTGKCLNGLNPAARADELIRGCNLVDVAERKKLFEGGAAAIAASTDPMIVFARSIDPDALALRKQYEEVVEEPARQAYAEIAKIRFAALGKTVAPDATFTLRLAFGTVKGYQVEGEDLPFQTTFGGAFAKADAMQNREPFTLPARWREARSKLKLDTPFNFVSTADTIGGNSGSPVLNRAGELIGINFDRNRHGLVRNFVYTDEQARHIAVHAQAVLAALELYEAPHLITELTK